MGPHLGSRPLAARTRTVIRTFRLGQDVGRIVTGFAPTTPVLVVRPAHVRARMVWRATDVEVPSR